MSEPWRPPPSLQHAMDLAELARAQAMTDFYRPSQRTHPTEETPMQSTMPEGWTSGPRTAAHHRDQATEILGDIPGCHPDDMASMLAMAQIHAQLATSLAIEEAATPPEPITVTVTEWDRQQADKRAQSQPTIGDAAYMPLRLTYGSDAAGIICNMCQDRLQLPGIFDIAQLLLTITSHYDTCAKRPR